MDELVTIAQAAEIAGVHRNTVRTWVKTGKLPSTKAVTPRGHTYLIPRSALDHPPQANPILSTSEVSVPLPAPTQFDLDTSLSRIVEPFIGRLQAAYEEVGQLRERVQYLERELERAALPPRPNFWRRLLG